jgi:hypothetical protein
MHIAFNFEAIMSYKFTQELGDILVKTRRHNGNKFIRDPSINAIQLKMIDCAAWINNLGGGEGEWITL